MHCHASVWQKCFQVSSVCLLGISVAAGSVLLLAAPQDDKTRDAAKAAPLPKLAAPEWLESHSFAQKSFTFVRIRYGAKTASRRSPWATDYPAADMNMARVVGATTKLDVSKPSRVLRLTEVDALAQYPFAYLAEPGRIQLSDAEVRGLRRYLNNGGFLVTDDFWGEAEWRNLAAEMKRVFPDREPKMLPLEHEIFRCVFKLKEKPQVVSVHHHLSGLKTERQDALGANYRAIINDDGRILVLMCHNTDLADGWERYPDSDAYRKEVSEPLAFPMGINIIYYALKHAPAAKD